MKIIIVGAGLGGLSAAFCFARRGHQVHLLERRATLSPRGGGINIRPAASRIMHSWGLQSDLEAISEKTPAVVLRKLSSGAVVREIAAAEATESPDWGTSREEVIKLLYRRACEAGAEILFDAAVAHVSDKISEKHPSVQLTNGTRIYGDLVIAADGIRSKIRTMVLSDLECSVDPIISTTTLYGIHLPCAQLTATAGTTRLTDQANINCWLGHNLYTVTRYNPKMQTVGFLFAIKSDSDLNEGLWDEHGDIDNVRYTFSGACSELVTALQLANECDRWKLAELPRLPRWTSTEGRVALLGDSAHAMHPNAAQGFSQIVEDIGVLDILIEKSPEGTSVAQITAAWQALRKPRVERIMEYSKFNTGLYSGGLLEQSQNPEKCKCTRDESAAFTSSDFLKWVYDFDAVEQAENYLVKVHPRI